eukprot:TRINITY_DN4855_c0_g4_i1.p1 TRINITY_DN4855_c0_g4~~TRINITY_DN4855_c0_g4_i1.p1  ORF type:complete len:789 (+),score=172.47 TRINITY_DN4855_c0_g4_i1:21-2387(+)
MASSCGVRVIARFRPINKRELQEDPDGILEIDYHDDTALSILKSNKTFTFDRVFKYPDPQVEVYEALAVATIEDVLKGFNGTIFAYGQTGSGKTFTMFGDLDNEEGRGVIPRVVTDIFKYLNNPVEDIEFTVKCSFLEIYREQVKDLLNPSKDNLRVRSTPDRGVWVEGLTEAFATNEQEVYDLLKLGEKFRTVSSTQMNDVSSRSHSLFIITVKQKLKNGTTLVGKLNLADLAGSEKVGKTGASGETLAEAQKINQSLLALGSVINALSSNGGHIPYRNSKLTYILMESLGGNCKTNLLVTCSPHEWNLDETVSTLQFAARAKTIKNKVTANKTRSVKELNLIIKKLKHKLSYVNGYNQFLENYIMEMKGTNFDMQSFKEEAKNSLKVRKSSNKKSPNKKGRSGSTNNNNAQEESPVNMNNEDNSVLVAEMQVEIEGMKARDLEYREEITMLLDGHNQLERENNELIQVLGERSEALEIIQSELDIYKEENTHLTKKNEYELNMYSIKIQDLEKQLNKYISSQKHRSSDLLVGDFTMINNSGEIIGIENNLLNEDDTEYRLDEILESLKEVKSEVTPNLLMPDGDIFSSPRTSQIRIVSTRMEEIEADITNLRAENTDLKRKIIQYREERANLEKVYKDKYEAMLESQNSVITIPRRVVSVVNVVSGRRISDVFRKSDAESNRDNIRKSGWLIKQGGFVRSWKKRWCEVEDDKLYYYSSESSSSPKGCIYLSDCVVQRTDLRPNCFGIFHLKNQNRTFYMATESEEECEDWVLFLNKLCDEISNDVI